MKSGGLGSQDADIGDVVALFKGRDGVDVQNHPAGGGPGLEYGFPEIIGYVAELHQAITWVVHGPVSWHGLPDISNSVGSVKSFLSTLLHSLL